MDINIPLGALGKWPVASFPRQLTVYSIFATVT